MEPTLAGSRVYAGNDEELVCVELPVALHDGK